VTQVQIIGLTLTSATTAWYMLCASKAYSNIWKSFLYIYSTSSPSGHMLLKAGFHKVAKEPPDIIERLTAVQLFVLFLLQIYWYSEDNF